MFKMQMNLFTAFFEQNELKLQFTYNTLCTSLTYLAEKEYGNLGMFSFFILPI